VQDNPLAYHITFGTYGTRLHGDPRGTVDRSMNQPGDPIIGADPNRWLRERGSLRFEPAFLSKEQRQFAESVIPDICRQGGWLYHIASAGPDHVHVLLSSSSDGTAVRKWFKRWLGERLSERWPLPAGKSWWAEGGSVKWVWVQHYFDCVFNYIRRQRITPDGPSEPGRTAP